MRRRTAITRMVFAPIGNRLASRVDRQAEPL